MIGLTPHNKYFLHLSATDMRKGFDGLSGLITNVYEGNPLDGSVYIFINRKRDKMKMLVWEEGGFMMYYKRLEAGTFELPRSSEHTKGIIIQWETLILMIRGIKLEKIIRKKRYQVA